MSEGKTFGALLIEGLQAAIAYERGELVAPTRSHDVPRDVHADEPRVSAAHPEGRLPPVSQRCQAASPAPPSTE